MTVFMKEETIMSSYKYKHLTLDDRITIQKALKEGLTFVEIGALLGKDPSTISKEVKAHLDYRNSGTRSRGYNPCKNRKTCTKQYICGKENCGFIGHLWNQKTYCSECTLCMINCSDFVEEKCPTIQRAPYVCNSCRKIRSCTLSKQFYDAKEAHKAYEQTKSNSRQGIDITPEELSRIDGIISPLIKQGQSVHQICINNAAEIMVDERTIYNYIDAGILSVGNVDLPRKVRYKKRKSKKVVRVDKKCHIGRTYDDFEAFIRRIIPKKTSFALLTQEKVNLMMNHINSYTRKKLNDRSAHQLFSFFYGEDTASKFNLEAIPANEIILKPELLK